MTAVEVLPSLEKADRAAREGPARGGDTGSGSDHPRFRGELAPGESMVPPAEEGRNLQTARHDTVATSATGVFSHPRKTLGDDGVLPPDGDSAPGKLRERRSRIPASAGVETALTAAARNAVFLCGASDRAIAPGATEAAMDESARLLETYCADLGRPASLAAGTPAVPLREDAR